MKMNLKWLKYNTDGQLSVTTIIFLFLYAFVLMLFFTESSPLFSMNEWVDPNAFFTMGKGMANGLVPYRDLFEQKGPLLYALHAFAYILSPNNFFGVYILESLVMFVNLIFAYKISKLYLSFMPSIMISIFYPIFILNHGSFRFGDSAEEFSIPLLMITFYMVLYHFKYKNHFSFSRTFYLLNGLMVGCVFWIKFTLIGAWIGFYLAILFLTIIYGNWKNLLYAFLYTLVGIIGSSVPWLLYFGLHHAIKDLVDVYIKFNLFSYPSSLSIVGKIINSAVLFGAALNQSLEIKVLILIGLCTFLLTPKFLVNKGQKYVWVSMVLFLILGVYFGGRRYPYYFLIVIPVTLFGLISLGYLFDYLNQKSRIEIKKFRKWDVFIIAAILSIFQVKFKRLLKYRIFVYTIETHMQDQLTIITMNRFLTYKAHIDMVYPQQVELVV